MNDRRHFFLLHLALTLLVLGALALALHDLLHHVAAAVTGL